MIEELLTQIVANSFTQQPDQVNEEESAYSLDNNEATVNRPITVFQCGFNKTTMRFRILPLSCAVSSS